MLLSFAISLVVSLIMIGIITFISVTEENKEIGILRGSWSKKEGHQYRVQRGEFHHRGVFRGPWNIVCFDIDRAT